MTATTRREAFILSQLTTEWTGLVDLRPILDMRGLSREAQDETLKSLSRAGRINIVPEDNRKALRPEDHAAAIHLGGEDNHLVALA